MSEEIIRELLANPREPIQDIPKYLAVQFNRINRIKARLAAARDNKENAKKLFETACANADREVHTIRVECRHESRSYQGDPAGGRDSYHECDICGKIL